MIIVKRCIRSYYEQHGNFDGIENTKFYKDVEKLASQQNVSVEQFLYITLGYKNDSDLTSVERYNYRKDFVKRDLAKLKNLFNVKSNKELVNILENLECLGTSAEKPRELANYEYVKLIASYLKYNRTRVFQINGGYITFGQLMASVSLCDTEASINKELKSDIFKTAAKDVAPHVKYIEGVEPVIQMGTLYTPKKFTPVERNKLLDDALMEALFNISKIRLANRLDVISMVNSGLVNLAEKFTLRYLTLLDIAHSLDLTVSELIEICGLRYVNILEQVEDMNCTVEMFGSDTVKVFSYRSKFLNDHILCNAEDFKYLYENDLLKSLDFENGIAYVTTNRRIPVSALFMDAITNDLRR